MVAVACPHHKTGLAWPGDARCIRWRWLPADHPLVKFCASWCCPIHGWAQRRKIARQHLDRLPQGVPVFNTVVFLNRRVCGPEVGRLIKTWRRKLLRAFPGAAVWCYVHVKNVTDQLRPEPHIHMVLFREGVPGLTLEAVTQKESFFRPVTYPEMRVEAWEEHVNPGALIQYLCRARDRDRFLPLEELPRAGDGYRLYYGQARRT